MRAECFTPLQPGDWMTVTEGLYAGIDGRVLEVQQVSEMVLRARLELPWGDEDWHAVWNEPMDESEWLTTWDTSALERHLCGLDPPPSLRKNLLFGCACARRIQDLLPNDACREAIEIGERLAEGPENESELRRTLRNLPMSMSQLLKIMQLLGFSGFLPTSAVLLAAVRHAALAFRSTSAEAGAQRELLRDIFGNPFRKPVIDPQWRKWQIGFIVRLARTIYDEHRFSELPILGDALEDAGCRDEMILRHCRHDAPHARGCWLLDALLELG